MELTGRLQWWLIKVPNGGDTVAVAFLNGMWDDPQARELNLSNCETITVTISLDRCPDHLPWPVKKKPR
jgi:hypothetical protein